MSDNPIPDMISVVLPSYNESENIEEALRRIDQTLGDKLLEILVIDDDSPDKTWQVVERMANSKFKAIRRIGRRGLASALAEGARTARGGVVVWLDCDLGIPPEDILDLTAKIGEYDVAIGSRYVKGGEDTRPKFRAFLSYVFNVYTRAILGTHFWDWTSGFAAAKKEALLKCPLTEEGFGDYFIEWVRDCYQHRLRVVEVPYSYGLRKAGVSKTDGNWAAFLRLGWRYAGRVIKVRMKKYHE